MKLKKSQIHSRVHSIPNLQFETTQLSSFSGLFLFQLLFAKLNLKERLRSCFSHLKIRSIFGHNVIFLMLIVHFIIGYRRLRGRDYYAHDPMVQRLLGLRKLPDVATISRALKTCDQKSIEKIRGLSQQIVLDRLLQLGLPRLTLDFDGSVLSTSRHAEGTAVGFNKMKKGARSYYPLFCTVAQTAQFFDMHHRAGNVHDSNGSTLFIHNCIEAVRAQLSSTLLEARLDSAFFEDERVEYLHNNNVEFTLSVPFERFSELKRMIESRKRWHTLDENISFFESDWKPASWKTNFRFLFVRKKNKKQIKGALQLDLFIPREYDYDYKVIVTNKNVSAKKVTEFHNGRGSQEKIFAEAKTHAALDYIPTRTLAGNQVFSLAALAAHNLARELQMQNAKPKRGSSEKRSPLWIFESLGTLRHRLIQRAGRLTSPQGKLTLTLSANTYAKQDLLRLLQNIQSAA